MGLSEALIEEMNSTQYAIDDTLPVLSSIEPDDVIDLNPMARLSIYNHPSRSTLHLLEVKDTGWEAAQAIANLDLQDYEGNGQPIRFAIDPGNNVIAAGHFKTAMLNTVTKYSTANPGKFNLGIVLPKTGALSPLGSAAIIHQTLNRIMKNNGNPTVYTNPDSGLLVCKMLLGDNQ